MNRCLGDAVLCKELHLASLHVWIFLVYKFSRHICVQIWQLCQKYRNCLRVSVSMFLPFLYFVLSLLFWLLTADGQFHRIYSSSSGCEKERRLFLVGTNVGKIYTIYICTCICKHFISYLSMMSILLNCLKAFYIHSIVFFFYIYLPSVKLIFSVVPTFSDILMTFLCGF